MKRHGILTELAAILLIVCVAIGLVACTNTTESKYSDSAEDRSGDFMSYAVDVSLNVVNLKKTSSDIENKAVELGGDLKSFSGNETYYKSLRLRVPSSKLDEFVNFVKEQGEVVHYYLSGENLSGEYDSAKTRKEALEKQYAELGELLSREGLTIAEEKDLIETRRTVYESILSCEEKIASYESQTDFAEVCVYLYQQEEPEEELSFWEKLGEVLSGSAGSVGKVIGWLIIVIVAILPYVGIVAVIFGLYVLIKFIVCKIRKKRFTLFANARANRAYRKRRKEAIQREYEEKRNQITYTDVDDD